MLDAAYMNLRQSLRARVEKSPLRDEKRFAAHVEDPLRYAWTEQLARSK
jgi:predicted O-linked N-acetylglucosamine transferase (SPINDLY family)